MADDDMQTRVSRVEWRLEALETSQQRQDSRMAALADRMETHHREVMGAIGSLRDDRARAEGAAEARLADAQKTRDRMKAVSLILGIIATMAALGWLGSSTGEASAAMLTIKDAPMPYMPPQTVEDLLP